VATAAAVLPMSAVAVVAVVGARGDGGNRGGLAAFNTCIIHTRFLVLVRHGDGNSVIETIRNPVRGAAVSEVASDRAPAILGGAAAANGRYVMSTATPLGRDATAIEGCWDRFFPVAPDA
jgi:hypothetical protein